MAKTCCAIVADNDENSLLLPSPSCDRPNVSKAVPKWRHRFKIDRDSSGSQVLLRIRRRRRPKTSIAALFLRFTRSGGIGKRQSRDKKHSCNFASDEEPHSGDDQAPVEVDCPPVIVTSPRYADILKARRAMIEMGSKPIWPVFVRPKVPKIQQNLPRL